VAAADPDVGGDGHLRIPGGRLTPPA
jgi:hypothetical protein